MRKAALLTDRAVIALAGADAENFLQGLITNNIEAAREGHALYAALLTPQGKILFDFLIVKDGERFLLDCAATRADELAKRLGFYRLRAKVEIAPQSDLGVAAVWGNDPIKSAGIVFTDPRLPALGQRAIAPRGELPATNATLAEYHTHRISLGVPDSADLPPDTMFALDAGFEELNGVSFTKGCYVGQEVTARMKHRATARRRMLIVEGDGPLPAPGTPLIAQGADIGSLATAQGSRGLALVRLDRLADAETARAPITAANINVTLRRPDWLRM
jgi:folate-binding protein YgfZ